MQNEAPDPLERNINTSLRQKLERRTIRVLDGKSTVEKMRDATQIPLKHDPIKSVETLADKFQLTENLPISHNLLPPTVNAYQSLPEYQTISA